VIQYFVRATAFTQYPSRLLDQIKRCNSVYRFGLRKVQESGQIKCQNRKIFIGHGFRGLHIALRSTTMDGVFDVFFCHQRIAKLDLKEPSLEQ
jgi:hypothetical protein